MDVTAVTNQPENTILRKSATTANKKPRRLRRILTIHFSTTYTMKVTIHTNQELQKSFLEKLIERHEKPVGRINEDLRQKVIEQMRNIILSDQSEPDHTKAKIL